MPDMVCYITKLYQTFMPQTLECRFITTEHCLTQCVDVLADVLCQLNLGEQYLASTHCVTNNNSPSNIVSCAAGNWCRCPALADCG